MTLDTQATPVHYTPPRDIPKARTFWYVASPYSKYPFGLDKAFETVCALTGRLIAAGYSVYSPIAHTHPIAEFSGLDKLDHNLWLPFDEAMMQAASGLLVLCMPSWRDSYGVRHEIDAFLKASKPILYLDPNDLRALSVAKEVA